MILNHPNNENAVNILYRKMTISCSSVVNMKISSCLGERPGRRMHTHACGTHFVSSSADFFYLILVVEPYLGSIKHSSFNQKSAKKAVREGGNAMSIVGAQYTLVG